VPDGVLLDGSASRCGADAIRTGFFRGRRYPTSPLGWKEPSMSDHPLLCVRVDGYREQLKAEEEL
jgi:hypothetical protein